MVFNLNQKTLADLSPGETARIVAISGPGRGLRLRLHSLGLRPGARVRLINRGPGGPVLVEVDGYRLALGRGVARRVLVAPTCPEEPQN